MKSDMPGTWMDDSDHFFDAVSERTTEPPTRTATTRRSNSVMPGTWVDDSDTARSHPPLTPAPSSGRSWWGTAATLATLTAAAYTAYSLYSAPHPATGNTDAYSGLSASARSLYSAASSYLPTASSIIPSVSSTFGSVYSGVMSYLSSAPCWARTAARVGVLGTAAGTMYSRWGGRSSVAPSVEVSEEKPVEETIREEPEETEVEETKTGQTADEHTAAAPQQNRKKVNFANDTNFTNAPLPLQ